MLAHEVWEYSCFFGIAKLMINGSISSLDIKIPQQKINKKLFCQPFVLRAPIVFDETNNNNNNNNNNKK